MGPKGDSSDVGRRPGVTVPIGRSGWGIRDKLRYPQAATPFLDGMLDVPPKRFSLSVVSAPAPTAVVSCAWGRGKTVVVPQPQSDLRLVVLGTTGGNAYLADSTVVWLEGFALMDSLIQDLRFALRTLRRRPGFTFVFVLTLALGIGSNLAMWSVADAVLLRDLPYEDPASLAVVWQNSPSADIGPLSIPTYRDLEERNRSFESLASFIPSQLNLDLDSGEPERVRGVLISDSFLRVLGRQPVLGRNFLPEDNRAGAERTAILSYEIWQRRFAGEDVLNQILRLDQQEYRVIGVLPEGLGQEVLAGSALGDIWLPVEIFRGVLPFDDRNQRPKLFAIGRLGASGIASAEEDLGRISQQLKEENPLIFRDSQLQCAPLREYLVRNDRQTVFLLLGAVLLVLVIACANLINLQLSRLAQREQEMATRWALGAEGRRLVRQISIENVVLGLMGGLVGVVFAFWLVKALPWMFGDVWQVDGLPYGALVGALVLSAAAGVFVGLIPAFRVVQVSRQNPFEKLQMRSSLPNKTLRQVLVGIEVALALTTLIWAGLLSASLARLSDQDPGFASAGRFSFQVILPQQEFDDLYPWLAFFDEALEELSRLPGVDSAALTSMGPLSGRTEEAIVAAGDRPLPSVPDMSGCIYQMVSPDFFRLFDIGIVDGRGLEAGDDDRRQAERVVVISRSLADAFWPDTSPIDQRLAFEFLGTPSAPEPQWRRVVGVAEDVRLKKLREAPLHAVYAPYTQLPEWFVGEASPAMTFLLHSESVPAATLHAESQALMAELAPETPLFLPREMDDLLQNQLRQPRRATLLLSAFALLALALVIVGVLGVVSYVVTARTREVGTRMAMGAAPQEIVWFFLKQTLQITCVGVLLGLLISISLSRLVSSLLYGLGPLDPLTYALAILIVLFLTLSATAVPALRAGRIRPLEALRYE